MSTTFDQVTIQLVREECCSCGITFAIPKQLRDKLIETGNTFYSPNGHGQHKTDSTKAKLKRERQKANRYRSRMLHFQEEADHRKNQARAYKGHLTRLKNSVKDGRCPCCREHFPNLQQHMKNEHPEYNEVEE